MLEAFDDGTPAFIDAWATTRPGQAHQPTVGIFDTVQWPRKFACDFAFVSTDLAPRIAAFEVDASSNASDHQAMVLTLG